MVVAKGKGGPSLGGGGQTAGDGDICDSVNNKNKEKIFFRTENRELH